MQTMLQENATESTSALHFRCPSCGSALGDIPASPQDPMDCPHCAYRITWEGDYWDACVDKSYPRDFARQWVLWEAGKLGDRNLVYGNEPARYFRSLLRDTSLTEKQLSSMRILEVGYGHGRLLRQLQRCSPTAYGLDLSKPLRSAQLRPGSAIFGNLLSIPFLPHQFDLVICRGVIHCTPDPQKSFACLADQVADGGLLYLAGLYEPGKGNLVLRKILPWCWRYPESVRLGLASACSLVRSGLEAIRSRTIDFRAFKRFYRHYKLDAFDIMAPQWTSVHAKDEVTAWFRSQGFQARKTGYGDYVGIRGEAH